MDIIKVDNVSKAFTNHLALDRVSLSVPEGAVYGLLGPNGAGKTTLIRIINHITAPDSGLVTFNGHPLTQADVANIGYLPEERGLYKKMKVGEQALYFARLKGLSRHDATVALHQWFERFGIMDWWNKKVEELSKGMAQKVQFIITVLHRPKLLVFDEPFSGFDPINANLLKEEILKLRDQGSTVIFSTHNMASVEEVCDHISLINGGKNVLSGNVDELRHRFFDNRFEITFGGEPGKLSAAIEPMVSDVELSTNPEGLNVMSVRLNEDTELHNLIDASNRAVSLRSFAPALASMNQIFIRTVKNQQA